MGHVGFKNVDAHKSSLAIVTWMYFKIVILPVREDKRFLSPDCHIYI